jgi:hypothetical protein
MVDVLLLVVSPRKTEGHMSLRRFLLRALAVASLGFLELFPMRAQFIPDGGKLTGTEAVGNARQGESVALSADGHTAIVGGPGDDSLAGASWIFTRTNGVWSQQGSKLIGTGAVGKAGQGQSVAFSDDGNTVIVGGPGDDSLAGASWIFTRTNGVWSQQGSKLVGTGAVGKAGQGRSVAFSADGNTAIVGGPGDDSLAGASWTFTRTNGVWSQQGNKLVGTGVVGDAQQGSSVALSADGNTAIVGGRGDNSFIGAAWVFTRTNRVWSQQGSKLVGTGIGLGGNTSQGHSVGLSADGNTAVVGGPGDGFGINSAGAVWVFTRTDGAWSQEGNKLVGTGRVGYVFQGTSVDVSGDGNITMVGGPADNSGAGASWAFTRTNGLWSQLGSKLLGAGAGGTAYQGQSVALSADGNTAIVGGYFDNSGAGAAWIFFRNATGVGGQAVQRPQQVALQQNYPNPCNPATVVSYQLPVGSNVRLVVYDMLGRAVSILVNERRDAGVHEVKFDGSHLSSGVYFYRLQVGEFAATRRLILLN